MANTNDITGKERVIQSIIIAMAPELEAAQLRTLDNVLRTKMHGLSIVDECTELTTWTDDNGYIMQVFLANKKLEGCKDGTLEQYMLTAKAFLRFADKNYRDITRDDVKYYMAMRSQQVKRNTLINIKHNLSSFFSFLHDEGYISSNPTRCLSGLKNTDIENIHLSIEEEVAVRDVPKDIREEAVIDFLFSTGVRVGELVRLDISNVDFQAGSVTFRGEKSDRIRTVVLDARAKLHLMAYLSSRTDNNPALFVTTRTYNGQPKRLGKAGAEKLTKGVGVRARLTKDLTVHVFRRTFATRLTDKGCPLQTLQELMGHANPDTTVRYIAKSAKRIQKAAAQYLDVA